jgi:aspartate-semialdehyde dehydrogenase
VVKAYNVAIVGATGMVGREILKILEERHFPAANLYLFATARSAGTIIRWNGGNYTVEELTRESFKKSGGIDIALFSAGGDTSLRFAPIAVENGCTVVDNSSAWRMEESVPLVVPEVNLDDLARHKGIIANPNCSTIQAVVALNPLHKTYHLKRIVYATYQAVSGAGMGGWRDLESEGAPTTFPFPIKGNCIPHIGDFCDNGYTKEEMKMIMETRKILHEPELRVTATTVRVPVFTGHCEAINAEFEKPFELDAVATLLKNSPGVTVLDGKGGAAPYPMPLYAQGTDDVYVGRIRRDASVENGLSMWVVSDNLRKGAASNAVQIAEKLIKI